MLRQPIAALAVLVLAFSPLRAEEPAKVASDDVREAPPAAVEEAKDNPTNRVVQA